MKGVTSFLQAVLLVWLSNPSSAHRIGSVVSNDHRSYYSALRSLSWVDPKEEAAKAPAETDADGDNSKSGTSDLSPLAQAVKDDASQASAGGSPAATAMTTTTTATTTTKPPNAPVENSTGAVQAAPATSDNAAVGGNSTMDGPGNQTKHAVINPVIDDITELFDDDSVKGSNTTLLPPEEKQPQSWPLIVIGIFLASALTLIAATGYKVYKKRSSYTQVSSIDV